MRQLKSYIFLLWHFLRGRHLALIVPAINTSDENELKQKFARIKNLGVKHVHIDVSDGVFSPAKLFDNPASLSVFVPYVKDFFIEVHLMVVQPLLFIEFLAEIGIRRIVFHVETVSLHEFTDMFFVLKQKFPRLEIGVATLPETDIEYIVPYGAICGFVECLSVPPGYSGQNMEQNVYEKIEYIRKNIPSCIIEVDGGVNVENARELKRLGANILVSGSFIFSSQNMSEAYTALLEA